MSFYAFWLSVLCLLFFTFVTLAILLVEQDASPCPSGGRFH